MTIESKDPEEIINVTFDFTSDLGTEAIAAASQVVTIAVVNGVDAGAAAMLNGAAVIVGSTVRQSVMAGIHGNDYKLRCKVDTSGARRLVLALPLPVRAR